MGLQSGTENHNSISKNSNNNNDKNPFSRWVYKSILQSMYIKQRKSAPKWINGGGGGEYAHKMKIKDLEMDVKHLINKFRGMKDELISIKRSTQKQTIRDVFDN